jgi:predicted PurR-regulated permease PerM
VVIFAFLAGSVLFGILGLLLAVPTAASVKIVLAYLYEEWEKAGAAG